MKCQPLVQTYCVSSPCRWKSRQTQELPHSDCFTCSTLLGFNTFELKNSYLTLLEFNTFAFKNSDIQHYSIKLAFNPSCIQQILPSTLLDFNNHGFNNPCSQQQWIEQSLFSTHLELFFLFFFFLLFYTFFLQDNIHHNSTA